MLTMPIVALLFCSAILAVGIALAAGVGLTLTSGWNPADSSERQLRRERRQLLVETAMKGVLACQLLSLLLFVTIADRLHPLFTGAMCAAGVLAASPLGYPTLTLKLATFVLAGLWLVVNRASTAALSTGVVRFKHLSLAGIAVAIVAENVLQLRYFLDLDPAIITSCCATIFDAPESGLGADLSVLPAGPVRIAFLVLLAGTAVTAALHLRTDRGSTLFSVFAVLLGLVATIAVLVWIAPSYYELPTHRCPFCLLAREHLHIGYLLYSALLTGIVSGGGCGLVRVLRRVDALESIRHREERGLCLVSLAAFAVFAAMALWPSLASSFRLEDL